MDLGLGVVVHTFNLRTVEAKVAPSLLNWSTLQAHSEGIELMNEVAFLTQKPA